mmetsp:Transcript_5932/g.6784  ORF Transcript_5932/g.6784 Transcript_5932/m.6784 type:complete len:116 (-) Transcript_5932:80-427(-)
MVQWNQEGFKVGLCSVPPINHPYSVLCLSNNCCIRSTFKRMEDRFKTLYDRRKAFVHHYTQYVEESHLVEALENIVEAQSDYEELQATGIISSFQSQSGDPRISASRSIYSPVIS